MGTFIIKHWLVMLPSTVTGLYLLRLMQRLYHEKMSRAAKPVPVTVPKRNNMGSYRPSNK